MPVALLAAPIAGFTAAAAAATTTSKCMHETQQQSEHLWAAPDVAGVLD